MESVHNLEPGIEFLKPIIGWALFLRLCFLIQSLVFILANEILKYVLFKNVSIPCSLLNIFCMLNQLTAFKKGIFRSDCGMNEKGRVLLKCETMQTWKPLSSMQMSNSKGTVRVITSHIKCLNKSLNKLIDAQL